MKTVIFGDCHDDLTTLGNKFNANRVDMSNIESAINNNSNYYVSIADISVGTAIDLASSASRLIIQPKLQWTSVELMKSTVYVCNFFNHTTPVENLDFYSELKFQYHNVVPDDPNPSLYLFGGSITFGKWLDDRNSRFGVLLSKKRNMVLVDHSKSGAGLRRSFEQLISCNPKPNDLVVLDLTDPLRLRLIEDGKIVDSTLHKCSKEMIMATSEEQLFYDQISYLDAFVKHCKALKLRLVFYSDQEYGPTFLDCFLHYSKHPEWCLKTSHIVTSPLDLCKDMLHPGPATHMAMCEYLDSHITHLYENRTVR
jgi:hypothetical protein